MLSLCGARPRSILAFSVYLLVAQLACAAAAKPAGAACPPDAPVVKETEAELAAAVAVITTFPTTLDPRLFANPTAVRDGQMLPEVRAAALALVDRNFDDWGMPSEFTVHEVELQGSAASYEWDVRGDAGLHVFLAHNGSVCPTSCKAPEGPTCKAACVAASEASWYNDLLEGQQEASFTDELGYTSAAPRPDSGVLLNGVVAEVTFLASQPPNQQAVNGTGLYSITADAWVMRPTEQPNNFDTAQIQANASAFVAQYNALLCEFWSAKASVLPDAPGALDFDCDRWPAFEKALKSFRGSGFDADLGSRSTSNLAYRLLRRISVNVVDQPGVWARQCENMKASVPNKAVSNAAPAPAPAQTPSSAASTAWRGGAASAVLAAILGAVLLAA